MTKKVIIAILTLTVAMSALLAPISLYATSIMDRIQSQTGTDGISQIEQDVDESTTKLIATARRIFIAFAIIFGIWLAITYFRAGFSPDTLRETKGRVGFFIIFLILSFWTESILAFVFNLLNIDLTEL